jgi:antitoxin HigA-1
MRMHNLPHPGEILSELWLAHGLIYTKAKLAQCISRKTLSKIVNGNSGISPKMAFRQSIAFGGSPGSWMGHQVAPDNGLWQVKQHKYELNIKPFLAHGLHCAPSPEQQSKSYRLNIQRGQICCWLLIVSVL